ADHAEDLARHHVQVEPVVHDLFAETIHQSAHPDDRITLHAGHHQPISISQMAKNASSTITSEIDCTTLEVVRSPSDCAVPLTCSPSRQPIKLITSANTGALPKPTHRCFKAMVSCMRARYCWGGISRLNAPTVSPPSSPAIIATKVSSGRVTNNA